MKTVQEEAVHRGTKAKIVFRGFVMDGDIAFQMCEIVSRQLAKLRVELYIVRMLEIL